MQYRCGRCGRTFTLEELQRLPWVRCPYCDSRIIYKIRPPVVKKIKAE
ncbi:MAG: DNA-directed RNA polymerase subunit P [Thermoprotei archaeon]|nr:MAG: DNA-directed RNA polymerase subunit P [Thermoprotei archaeon]RLF18892.1 MAG: DNA-directed RNA polymerase subunit P [Thermoprotei archaeon]